MPSKRTPQRRRPIRARGRISSSWDASAPGRSAVERPLDSDRSQRFQSAGAFESALATFLDARAEHDSDAQRRTLSIALKAVVAGIVIGTPVYWVASRAPVPLAAPAPVAAPTVPAAHTAGEDTIDAALYRVADGTETKVRPGDRLAPGDQLALQIQVSQPTHIYVVNEDDSGESYLLFPLPDQAVANPIPAGPAVRLPAIAGKAPLSWEVTSAGGREHFLIFATPEPLPAFDRMFASLPRPQFNAPVLATPLSGDAVGLLRGVGGLSASRRAAAGRLAEQFTTPLPATAESATGVWVRQITLDNPRYPRHTRELQFRRWRTPVRTPLRTREHRSEFCERRSFPRQRDRSSTRLRRAVAHLLSPAGTTSTGEGRVERLGSCAYRACSGGCS
jgi:hypothetical protein